MHKNPVHIPRPFIDELLSRVDIVAVVSEYVTLKKKGREYTANCPFHDEKTPSFTVSNTKQFYHCFGCGAHGSAIGFLMDYARMGFVDAVHTLAERVGMEVPREVGGERIDYSYLYEILEKSSGFFTSQLHDQSNSDQAVAYLKRRHINRDIAVRFDVGYAPSGWDNLLKSLGPTKTSRQHLREAGLVIETEGGKSYDRFRNRIMFPIRDGRGRVIGFGGRVLGDETPKYLNTPETPVFHKGQELYGLYQATQKNRTLARIVVVEGYMDVISLAQRGIWYAVATLGTATSTEHLNRIYRVAPEVVFCFDADIAGRKAAWRALENTLPLMRDGRQASFMFLPEGEDPDSFVKKAGKEAFETQLTKATPLSSFLFEHLSGQVDISTLDGKARLVELAKPVLSRLPPSAFRELVFSHLGKISGLERESLDAQFTANSRPGSVVSPHRNATKRRIKAFAKPSGTPSLVEKTISLLLHNPGVTKPEVDSRRLATLEITGVSLLVEMLDLLKENPNIATGAVVEYFRDRESGPYLAKLAAQSPPLLTEGLERELADAFEKIVRLLDGQRYEYLVAKSARSLLTEEEKQELRHLLRQWLVPSQIPCKAE